MSTPTGRLHRWDEIALEKVTEMISRKIVTGDREMLAQIYLKKGALVPMHSHESEQMTYVLQGAMKVLVGGEEITLREGEVLHIPSWVEHQAEALDDTFELDVFSPIRQDWLDHTDSTFTSSASVAGKLESRAGDFKPHLNFVSLLRLHIRLQRCLSESPFESDLPPEYTSNLRRRRFIFHFRYRYLISAVRPPGPPCRYR
jgi:quercetin dioxygenase-like cupin family protein